MLEKDLKLPKVDVLISVFNGIDFINQCINAIRAQTYPNINLVIIDDGSTDGSTELIQQNLTNYDTYIKLPSNSGLINALNVGLSHCKAQFILRTDIDDVCHPSLVEELAIFLHNNRDYVACGTNMIQFPSYGEIIYPEDDLELKAVTLYKAPFSHSCVMINRELAGDELYYSKVMKSVEDVELWSRLFTKGKYFNLQKFLLYYRVSENQITKHNSYHVERNVGLFSVYYNFGVNQLNLDCELAKIYAGILSDTEYQINDNSIQNVLKLYRRTCTEFYKSKYFENVRWNQVLLNKFVFHLSNKNIYQIFKSAYLSPSIAFRVLKLKSITTLTKFGFLSY
jgi:glycosyltransferase involved in cell wall biosynthesis